MSSSQNYYRRFQMVTGIALDGRIAGSEGSFSPYSSPEDKAFLDQKIEDADVLIMGRKTYEKHVAKVKKPLIIFTSQAEGGLEITEKDGHMIHLFNDSAQELINLCDALQYKNIACLGGAEIYHWFLEKKLATDLYLTIEPFIFGSGRNLLHGGYLHEYQHWKLKSHEQLNDDGSLLLHYQPH
jgi:dihydrofolate reductase